MTLPNEAYMASPLIWLCWLRATFLGRCCAVLANLNSLPCPFNLWRYLHQLPKEPSAFRDLGTSASPASQAFFRGVTGNLRWPCNSYMLQASKISIDGWREGVCQFACPLRPHLQCPGHPSDWEIKQVRRKHWPRWPCAAFPRSSTSCKGNLSHALAPPQVLSDSWCSSEVGTWHLFSLPYVLPTTPSPFTVWPMLLFSGNRKHFRFLCSAFLSQFLLKPAPVTVISQRLDCHTCMDILLAF